MKTNNNADYDITVVSFWNGSDGIRFRKITVSNKNCALFIKESQLKL